MIDGLRIGNMYHQLEPDEHEPVAAALRPGGRAAVGADGRDRHQRRDHERHPEGRRQHASAARRSSTAPRPSLQGSNVTDRSEGARPARRVLDAEEALRHQRRGRRADQAGQACGSTPRRATSRTSTTSPAASTRSTPTAVVAPTTRRSQAYGGTYTYDNNGRVTVGDQREAEDLRLVRLSVQGGSALAACRLFNASPEAVAHHHVAHAALDDEVDLHRDQPTAVRGRHRGGREPRHDPARSRSGRHLPGSGIAGAALHRDRRTRRPATSPIARRPDFDFDDRLPSQTFNASASYVTGSHNAKVGFEMQRGHFWRGDNNDSTGGIWYTVNQRDGRCPPFVTIQAPAAGWQNNLNYNLGIFAQDRWTHGPPDAERRRSSRLPERVDRAVHARRRTAGCRTGTRTSTRSKNVPNWKDINPRVSAAYDLFGNGKTALKAQRQPRRRAGLDRYRRGEQPGEHGRHARRSVPGTTWHRHCGTMRLRSRLRPDQLATANGECGAWLNPNFGSAVPGTRSTTARSWTAGACGRGTGSSRPASSRSSCRACRRRSATSAASTATSTITDNEALSQDRLHAVLGDRADDRPRPAARCRTRARR